MFDTKLEDYGLTDSFLVAFCFSLEFIDVLGLGVGQFFLSFVISI